MEIAVGNMRSCHNLSGILKEAGWVEGNQTCETMRGQPRKSRGRAGCEGGSCLPEIATRDRF